MNSEIPTETKAARKLIVTSLDNYQELPYELGTSNSVCYDGPPSTLLFEIAAYIFQNIASLDILV